ncbi:hypothetical protein [Kaistia soli]|nr:hypothetical protein [Kaistia soli]
MTVFFARPFHLSDIEGAQPSGTYRLVVDEEDVSGLNFTAFRRKATMLHLPALELSVLSRQVVSVDAEEFEAAVAADQHR